MVKITNKDQILLLPTTKGFVACKADNLKPLDLVEQKLAMEYMAMHILKDGVEEVEKELKKKPKRQTPTLTIIEGGKK